MFQAPVRLLLTILLLSGCDSPSSTVDVSPGGGMVPSDPYLMATPFIHAGINQPVVFSAAAAPLNDDQPVIGIVANGQARAYSVQALSGATTHVVNDLVGEIPVSVTYCDRADCARVFSQRNHAGAIDLWTGGWNGREMLLSLNGQMYPQSSKELPLADYSFERTTWSEWKASHPDTEVFVGLGAQPDPDDAAPAGQNPRDVDEPESAAEVR